jgi:hypothetical protein
MTMEEYAFLVLFTALVLMSVVIVYSTMSDIILTSIIGQVGE